MPIGLKLLERHSSKNQIQKYSAIQVTVHWIVAALVFGQWLTSDAYYQTRNPFFPARPSDLLEFSIHTWAGASIGVLMLIRLGLWICYKRPAVAGNRWQRMAASIVHASLYGLILAQVGTGLVAVYVWPGAGNLHSMLWTAILIVLTIHILAAALHAWRGERGFSGMIPTFRIPGS